MATINLGAIKFKWQGAYNAGTAYTVDDVVSYQGSSYICILASTGNLPTNATYFEQMSSAGTNGTDGTDLGTTLTTQGDIVYRDASGLARLGAGTAGQALITNGTGANPSWGDAGGGKVLQVVTSNFSNQVTTTSGSFVTTGHSLTITPEATSSKIFLILNATGERSGTQMCLDIHESTSSSLLSGGQARGLVSSENNGHTGFAPSILVSPNTTSAITYTVYFANIGGATSYYGRTDMLSSFTAFEIGA